MTQTVVSGDIWSLTQFGVECSVSDDGEDVGLLTVGSVEDLLRG